MDLSTQGIKVLWGRSGGRCARCRRSIVEDAEDGHAYPVGDQAHIVARNRLGPRGSGDESARQRARVENFILLCGSCHDLIDKARDAWPSERLRRLKADHEAWVQAMGERLAMTEFAGKVDVRVADVAEATGVDVRSPTRFRPGARVTVHAQNAGRVTGVRIDTSNERGRGDA